MLEIRFGAIDGDGHTPIIARNGDHVGRVVDRDGDTRCVNVADDDGDRVRLVV